MGLKDQQLALRFIHEHIRDFGGDPDLITIFGHSAGASSVHLHVLQDSSASLIRRAIPMSGAAGNAFAVQPKSDHILIMFKLGRFVRLHFLLLFYVSLFVFHQSPKV